VQGDQASIVAGGINFVKELEQTLQSLEAQKRFGARRAEPPFAGFFSFPQYSPGGVISGAASSYNNNASVSGGGDHHQQCAPRRGAADIEVAVAESHANVKVRTPRRPRQLLRMAVAMQCLGLTVLHLNVTTTADNLALYTFSLKVTIQKTIWTCLSALQQKPAIISTCFNTSYDAERSFLFSDRGRMPAIVGRLDRRRGERDTREDLRGRRFCPVIYGVLLSRRSHVTSLRS
jgi:hypothetical protein